MHDALKNPRVNIEIAAAVYLSAKMEAITRHDQTHYFHTPDHTIETLHHPCGTAACLAGHVLIIDQGSFDKAKNYKKRCKLVEALRVLIGGSENFPFMLGELQEKIRTFQNDETLRSMRCVYVLIDSFRSDLSPDEALLKFRKWVKEFSSEKDYARFEALIELNIDKLYEETNMPKELLAYA